MYKDIREEDRFVIQSGFKSVKASYRGNWIIVDISVVHG